MRHYRNEDACAIARVEGPAGVVHILVVCDGVSTTSDPHLAARGAARAACDHLERVAREAQSIDVDVWRQAQVAAALAAHAAVLLVPRARAENPSCTFVASVACDTSDGRRLLVTAWLGDSRAYVITDDGVALLSIDDSWAAEQLAAGVDAATVWADGRAHSITRWLGADAIDLKPRLDARIIAPGGQVLLCSDGLWNYAASEADMGRVVGARRGLAPIALARSLTDFARDAGGQDNITVAVARLDR